MAQAPAPEPDGNKALAREWADKAIERFDAGDYQGAIDRIREAQKHARPPTFTRFEAQAHEKQGKLLEAQRLYRAVADLQLPKDAVPAWVNAQEGARKELKALTPRIPKLEIRVSGAEASALAVTLDGAPFDVAQLGRPVPQNPGAHTIVVRANDRPPVTKEVLLREGASERVEVRVPAPSPSLSAPPPSSAQPAPSGPQPPIEPGGGAASSVPPALKWIAFGVGGAGLVAGGVTGGLAIAGRERAREECGPEDFDGGLCRADRAGALADARLAAQIATPALVVAGVGLAAGVTLVILERKKAPTVGVVVAPGFLTVRGAF